MFIIIYNIKFNEKIYIYKTKYNFKFNKFILIFHKNFLIKIKIFF